MNTFAVYHKRLDKGFVVALNDIGHTTRLFILNVPEGITAPYIGETLRKAGRDPALMDVSVSGITIAAESQWPTDVYNAQSSTGVEKIEWDALLEDSKGARRITIRVMPELFAKVQSEAQRRDQSLNNFCVEALQIQVGTRSHQIEGEIFQVFYSGTYSESKPFRLPDLWLLVSRNIPDCKTQEIEFALRRLCKAGYVLLNKWDANLRGLRKYEGTDNETFFYWEPPFNLTVTPTGKSYAEALIASARAMDGYLKVLRAEELA